MEMNQADVIIFGAGPAGLASAYKLAKNGKKVVIFEKDGQVGGISKTIRFKNCFFDLGGHRFHTDFPEVFDLWKEVLGKDFLVRSRLSRIYYKNKFFNYPLTPLNALFGLGVFSSMGIILSYLKSKAFPFKEEKNFEQWVSNRFGKKLFRTFFKTYTEKVWGMPCNELGADWSAQRIKNLSLFGAIKNSLFPKKEAKEKTLISRFRYPKFGPGMMYEKMAQKIIKAGGEVMLDSSVEEIECEKGEVKNIVVIKEGKVERYQAKNFISTIPIDDLVKKICPKSDSSVTKAIGGLKYRSFVSISVILKCPNPFLDNWIYVHSPEIKLGRVQNFKNWSPFMVGEKDKIALGLEYFCDRGDDFWNMDDKTMIDMGLDEFSKLNLVKRCDFIGGFVSRISKAYPVYDSGYADNMKIIRSYLDAFKNLQTIGRGGLFRYNNMDHSVLAGLWAAGNIIGEKNNVWNIND